MGIKLLDKDQVSISAKADPAHPFTMRWISQRTKDWAVASVKISCTGDYQDGVKPGQITIIFDVAISEQSVIT